MSRSRYLILHKDEWQRLKEGGGVLETPRNDKKVQYLKELNEMSQKWLKSWPDTKEGHIAQLEKQKKRKEAEQNALLKSFKKMNLSGCTEQAISDAKQLIFENSCYGHRLKGALLQSKALEENDALIKFKKELNKKSLDTDHSQISVECCSFDLDKHRSKDNISRKMRAKEIAQFNKSVHETVKDKISKSKAKEVQDRFDDAIAIQRMMQIESDIKEKCKTAGRQMLDECRAEQERFREERAKREEREQRAADRYKIQQDNLRAQIQNVYKQLYYGQANCAIYQNNYKLLENIKKDEQRRYEIFVEKGIKDVMERHQQTVAMAEKPKTVPPAHPVGIAVPSAEEHKNRSSARQCILPKCGKNPRRKGRQSENNTTNFKFLERCNTLAEKLRQRESQPSPWTGAKAAHAQFAQQANETLKLCKYKGTMRRIIDDYIKFNGLTSAELSVPNQDF